MLERAGAPAPETAALASSPPCAARVCAAALANARLPAARARMAVGVAGEARGGFGACPACMRSLSKCAGGCEWRVRHRESLERLCQKYSEIVIRMGSFLEKVATRPICVHGEARSHNFTTQECEEA